jgi:hypothetical protein
VAKTKQIRRQAKVLRREGIVLPFEIFWRMVSACGEMLLELNVAGNGVAGAAIVCRWL